MHPDRRPALPAENIARSQTLEAMQARLQPDQTDYCRQKERSGPLGAKPQATIGHRLGQQIPAGGAKGAGQHIGDRTLATTSVLRWDPATAVTAIRPPNKGPTQA